MTKVLSVPAGKTFDWICKHKIYSCPESYFKDDSKLLAPRNAEGWLPVIFSIDAIHILNPLDVDAAYQIPEAIRNRIAAYIAAVRHLSGILDNGGVYRFYVLSEFEQGRLNPVIKPSKRLTNYCHFNLAELLGGQSQIDPIVEQ